MTDKNVQNICAANKAFAEIDGMDAKALAYAGIQANYLDALQEDRRQKRADRAKARRDAWDNIPVGGKIAIYVIGGVTVAFLIVGGVVVAKKILEANEASGCGCAEAGDASLLVNFG